MKTVESSQCSNRSSGAEKASREDNRKQDPTRTCAQSGVKIEHCSRCPNVSQTFGSRRNLIAGTSIIAVSAVAGLTYFFLFLASPGSKTPGETALQSASATSAQAALDVPAPPSPTRAQSSSETSAAVPEPSRGASSASPSPDVPVSLTANASAQVAPSAMTPSRESVFLQRPGVNIRSAPSGNAPVLGTAPRGTSFTATSREGDWVQVENPNWKGWINSQFLAPNKPL
jgi:cytoskeletal protein RodZ